MSGPASVHGGLRDRAFSGDQTLKLMLNRGEHDLPKGLTWICPIDPDPSVSAS